MSSSSEYFPYGDHYTDEDLIYIVKWLREQTKLPNYAADPPSAKYHSIGDDSHVHTTGIPFEPDIEWPKSKVVYKLSLGILLRAYSGHKRILRRGLVPKAAIPSSLPLDSYDIPHNPTSKTDGEDEIGKDYHNGEEASGDGIFDNSKLSLDVPINYSEERDPVHILDSDINRINAIVRYYIHVSDVLFLDKSFSPEDLYITAIELSKKSLTLSPDLMPAYYQHPLYPRNSITKKLLFHEDFLRRVKLFHQTVRRPEGAYDVDRYLNDPVIQQLINLPRDPCSACNSKRHLYCGDCGGIPTPIAVPLLPERKAIPFDILLLIHWQESLHKCTGMHARVLCEENMVQYQIWPRLATGGDFGPIVESLNADTDVLLFPCGDAIPAQNFSWHSPATKTSSSVRKRLVVLEASWNHGKTMASQIIEYRQKNSLPPIPCILIENVVGEYWRFQKVGHSAVSTIEAIAHVVSAALGKDEGDDRIASDLLILFRIQKLHVLKRVASGGRPPQAIAVEGSGIGSWTEYTGSVSI